MLETFVVIRVGKRSVELSKLVRITCTKVNDGHTHHRRYNRTGYIRRIWFHPGVPLPSRGPHSIFLLRGRFTNAVLLFVLRSYTREIFILVDAIVPRAQAVFVPGTGIWVLRLDWFKISELVMMFTTVFGAGGNVYGVNAPSRDSKFRAKQEEGAPKRLTCNFDLWPLFFEIHFVEPYEMSFLRRVWGPIFGCAS